MHVVLCRTRVVLVVVVLFLLVGASLGVLALRGMQSNERIQVVRVWSDAVDAPAGMVFYLLDVNVSNEQSAAWQVDPTLFTLDSNASHVYFPVSNYSEVSLLEPSSVSRGQRLLGNVAFLLPKNESPVALSYGQGGSVRTSDIPAVSGVASRFDPFVHVQYAGAAASSAVAGWNGITNQTNGLTFFGEEPGFRNYSFVFFTGQRIYVTLALYYYPFPYDPKSISVASVTSGDGYTISDVAGWQSSSGNIQPHQLPVTMSGYGSNVEVTLLVTVPPGQQPGVLHFTLNFV